MWFYRSNSDVLAYITLGIAATLLQMLFAGEYRYSKIFILPPWEEIYVSDEARYENYEQAKLIQNHLIETYEG
jgi:predicted ATPase